MYLHIHIYISREVVCVRLALALSTYAYTYRERIYAYAYIDAPQRRGEAEQVERVTENVAVCMNRSCSFGYVYMSKNIDRARERMCVNSSPHVCIGGRAESTVHAFVCEQPSLQVEV